MNDLDTLIQSELRVLEKQDSNQDVMFKKIVLSFILSAKKREEVTDSKLEALEKAVLEKIEKLEDGRVAKLECRCEELERKILRLLAYATGISTGVSVSVGFITFWLTKP